MPGEVTAGLKFGEAVAKLWTSYLKSKDRNRMQKAIEASEKYIQVNQKDGEFAEITDKRKSKLLSHYAKRFFHYN